MGNLDYTQDLNKIENTRRFGNEPGVVVTAQVIKVLREKGKQKRIIPYIHVAGTNGKGSVCAFFSSILKKDKGGVVEVLPMFVHICLIVTFKTSQHSTYAVML